MTRPTVSAVSLLFALSLGCASAPRPVPLAPAVACPGEVSTPAGMRPAEAPPLRARAVRPPGQGGLCAGTVFEVVAPVRVYRVWSRSNPASRTGRWWTLTAPEGPRDRYREVYAICPEWSELDAVVSCSLRVGVRVVVGPGQSANCAGGGSYPVSAAAQVFVPTEGEAADILADCSEPRPWP